MNGIERWGGEMNLKVLAESVYNVYTFLFVKISYYS